MVDTWDRDAPDPIIADPDSHNVRISILLIGPSAAWLPNLDVPLVLGDATSLTEAGYVGDDVESLLIGLLQAADGDLDVAQRGIVSIDEIDRLRAGGMGGKEMRLGVQHALLKMLEGTVATMPPGGGFKHPVQPGVPFHTTDILFICGGA